MTNYFVHYHYTTVTNNVGMATSVIECLREPSFNSIEDFDVLADALKKKKPELANVVIANIIKLPI